MSAARAGGQEHEFNDDGKIPTHRRAGSGAVRAVLRRRRAGADARGDRRRQPGGDRRARRPRRRRERAADRHVRDEHPVRGPGGRLRERRDPRPEALPELRQRVLPADDGLERARRLAVGQHAGAGGRHRAAVGGAGGAVVAAPVLGLRRLGAVHARVQPARRRRSGRPQPPRGAGGLAGHRLPGLRRRRDPAGVAHPVRQRGARHGHPDRDRGRGPTTRSTAG